MSSTDDKILTDGGSDVAAMSDNELAVRTTQAWDANQGDDLRKLKVEAQYRADGATAYYEDDIPHDVARRAHSGTSFSPEQRAESERSGYAATLRADFSALAKHDG